MRSLAVIIVVVFGVFCLAEGQEVVRKGVNNTLEKEEVTYKDPAMALPRPVLNEGGGAYMQMYDYGDPCGMYLNKEWQEGVTKHVDGTQIDGEFRYNICIQKMEAIVDGDTFAFANPEELSTITIGKSNFIYLHYIRATGEVGATWFEVLCEGNCSLYLRRFIKYRRSDGDLDHSNDQLYRLEEYYTRRNGMPLEYLYVSKSSVMDLLADHDKEVLLYMRSEKLKVKYRSDLKKIFTFYNHLH